MSYIGKHELTVTIHRDKEDAHFAWITFTKNGECIEQVCLDNRGEDIARSVSAILLDTALEGVQV
jgi:hypothetical protein